jgi:hypothetical protein
MRVTHALPMPCATAPGDILGILLEGTGAPAGTVVVFGQAFRPGDLPRGARLVARRADGQPLAAQADVHARHADGSAKHATVALAAPALPAGARLGVVLSRSASPAAPALDRAALLEGREAVLELSQPGGGQPWRVDLLGALRGDRGRPWQDGPLAAQGRLSVNVPPEAVGGAGAMRLLADVALRADGTLWTDAWLRNDIAMTPRGGTASYTVRIVLDGREALRAEVPQHFQYQGWGRLIGSARGRPAPEPPVLRPNTAYLTETGAIARWDLSIGIDTAFLERIATQMTDPRWVIPLDGRWLTRMMGAPGNRLDIGPVTGWQAAWLHTGDPRAARFCEGQAEAAGSVPWHHWDPRGGWIDQERWPGLWTDPRGGRPPLTLTQHVGRETGWGQQSSHHPELCYIPYLLTGRRALLDNLTACAAWNVVDLWPHPRNHPRARPEWQGWLIANGRQGRSSAWGLRTVTQAAWIVPDDDVNRPYLNKVASINWAWLRSMTPEWTQQQGELAGYLPTAWTTEIGPWQQDFVAFAAATATRMGHEDGRAFLTWMSGFLVGRFEAADHGFNRRDGINTSLPIAPRGVQDTQTPYTTWAQVAAELRLRDQASTDTQWRNADGYFGRLAMASLAQLDDLLDHPRALQHWRFIHENNAPHTSVQTAAMVPPLNVAPRRAVRVPGSIAACTVAAPSRS